MERKLQTVKEQNDVVRRVKHRVKKPLVRKEFKEKLGRGADELERERLVKAPRIVWLQSILKPDENSNKMSHQHEHIDDIM